MISCYSLEQPTSYSLVDVTDSLPPSLSLCLPVALPHRTVAGTQTFMQIRTRETQSSLFARLKRVIKVLAFFSTVLSLIFILFY